jgi:hypothetical protein
LQLLKPSDRSEAEIDALFAFLQTMPHVIASFSKVKDVLLKKMVGRSTFAAYLVSFSEHSVNIQ